MNVLMYFECISVAFSEQLPRVKLECNAFFIEKLVELGDSLVIIVDNFLFDAIADKIESTCSNISKC